MFKNIDNGVYIDKINMIGENLTISNYQESWTGDNYILKDEHRYIISQRRFL